MRHIPDRNVYIVPVTAAPVRSAAAAGRISAIPKEMTPGTYKLKYISYGRETTDATYTFFKVPTGQAVRVTFGSTEQADQLLDRLVKQ